MKKVIIYGAGGTGIRIERQIRKNNNVIAFIDSDTAKQGTFIDSVPCIALEQLKEYDFDKIIIGAATGYHEMIQNLMEMGVSSDMISTEYTDNRVQAREIFLRNYADMCEWYDDSSVCVAEAGVFRGEFAKTINEVFSSHSLYLYDTFEGFDQRDITNDELKSDVFNKSEDMIGHFADTSIQLVLSRMPYRNNCVVRKGYFPNTFKEQTKKFGFVSLDMDLYHPMKAGLECFYPITISGGVILLDDCFTPGHPNVMKAIKDYENENNITLAKLPIGDGQGVAVLKI